MGDVVGGEDLICELSAGFKRQLFGEDERVIAVEKEGGDLSETQSQ
jgi:hypothetical protein